MPPFHNVNSSDDLALPNTNNSLSANNALQQCSPSELDSTADKIGKTLAYSVILVFALCGNAVVVHVVLKNKLLRKTINCFVVNMAVSDLLIPLVVIPRKITEIITDSAFKWLVDGLLGELLCKFVFFAQDVSTAVSVLTLLFIAMNRFGAVVFPLQTSFINSVCSRVVLLALSWVFALGLHAPYFYAFKLAPGPDGDQMCTMNWEPAFENIPTMKRYSTALLLVIFIIPFILLAVLYSFIWIHLKRQGSRMRQVSYDRARRQRTNRNVLKMAITIVISFALCWAPFNIYVFLVVFVWDWQPPFCFSKTFQFVAPFMGYANSAINPCIYFIFVENYRTGLKRMLPSSFSRSSLASNPKVNKQHAVEMATVDHKKAARL